jgi:hypothetical protein
VVLHLKVYMAPASPTQHASEIFYPKRRSHLFI